MWLFGFFILGTILFFAAIGVLTLVSLGLRRNRRLRQHREEMAAAPALSQHHWQALKDRVPFYRRLSAENQRRFEHRLAEVIRSKSFLLKGVDAPQEEVETVIGSTIVQLAFGLPLYSLPSFSYINVLSGSFARQEGTGSMAAHLDVSARTITFSWPAVLAGASDPGDGVSVVMESLAMALYQQNFSSGEESHFFAKSLWVNWREASVETFGLIRSGRQQLFPKEAGAQLHGFFGKGMVAFFEQPFALSQQHPKLFDAYCSLLNQDPRRLDDPVISLNEAIGG